MQKLPNYIRANATPKVLQTLACASEGFALKAAAEGDGKKIRSFSMTAYTGAAMNIMGFYRPVVVGCSALSWVMSQPLGSVSIARYSNGIASNH